MSPLAESALISGAIFAFSMLRGYGTRAFTAGTVAMPVVLCLVFGVLYLKDAPAAGADLVLYAVALGLGLAFGLAGAAFTTVFGARGSDTGGAGGTRGAGSAGGAGEPAVYTHAGAAFAATWFVGLSARIVIVWAMTDVPGIRTTVGEFLFTHGIDPNTALPAFFVLWAITMVGVRTAIVAARAARIRQQRPAVRPGVLV
ncbi:hypothetical protein [Nakamurella aerolata]|uniref:DUF1453 domain-containing protein n=1 Tax=Nakamurella aerolata TaxID=1656892 RepID=A0A849A9U5_9ACTN|nr:hypothetical protein [Nakamurella aerolata]NNG36373.1 hypothetical protein [Nakamurella aerolata]